MQSCKGWHHLFSHFFLKHSIMPNQGNKANGKSGIVRPKKNSTMPSKKKQDSQGNATKSNGANDQKNDAGSSDNAAG